MTTPIINRPLEAAELASPNPVAFPLVKLDTSRITDRETFHTVFAEVLGFPKQPKPSQITHNKRFNPRCKPIWLVCFTQPRRRTMTPRPPYIPNNATR